MAVALQDALTAVLESHSEEGISEAAISDLLSAAEKTTAQNSVLEAGRRLYNFSISRTLTSDTQTALRA